MTDDEISAALDAAGGAVPPVAPRGRGGRPRPGDSWEDVFQQHAVPVEGGHIRWTGATSGRGSTPVVAFDGQVQTGYRLSFRWHYGREPDGYVLPTCPYPHCLAGGHLADRVMREEAAS